MTSTNSFTNNPNNKTVLWFDGKPIRNIQRLGPDSFYVPNFMQDNFPASLQPTNVFEETLRTGHWIDRDYRGILQRGHEQKRAIALATANTDVDHVTGIPMSISNYSYTSATWRSLLKYKTFRDAGLDPIVEQMMKLSFSRGSHQDQDGEDKLPQRVGINHVMMSKYERESDNIKLHQDSEDDIVDGSLILVLSLGDARQMLFQKLGESEIESITLDVGSLFVLGSQTNHTFLHSIAPIKRLSSRGTNHQSKTTNTADATTRGWGTRISIVFRHVKKTVTKDIMVQEIIKSIDNAINRDCEKTLRNDLKTEINNETKTLKLTDRKELITARKQLRGGKYSDKCKEIAMKKQENKARYYKEVIDKIQKYCKSSTPPSLAEVVELDDLFEKCSKIFHDQENDATKHSKQHHKRFKFSE